MKLENERQFEHDYPLEKGDSTVYLRVESEAWSDDFDTEALNANHIGGNSYQLSCVPLITYGYNRHDIVEVASNGFIISVIDKSEHSSARILLYNHDAYQGIITEIAGLGLDIEYNSHTLFGIDLPSSSSKKGLISLLNKYAKDNILAYEFSED